MLPGSRPARLPGHRAQTPGKRNARSHVDKHGKHLPGHAQKPCQETWMLPGSRQKACERAWVLRHHGTRRHLTITMPAMLPSTDLKASAPRTIAFSVLHSPAHPYRCRCFACPLAGTDARLAEKRGLVTPSFRGTCTPCLLPVRLAHQIRCERVNAHGSCLRSDVRRGVVRVNRLERLARSLSVQECKTPSGISTVRPRSSGSL